MSNTNRVAVRLIEEGTKSDLSQWGITPSNPAFQELRVTNAAVSFSPQTITSNELRADRQTSDLILVGAEAGGNLGMEMSFGAADALLEGAMFSSWVNKPFKYNATADTAITAVTDATDTFTVDANGTTFKQYHLIRTSGFTNSANNGVFVVSSSTSTTVVVAGTPTLTDESVPPAGARIQVVGFEAPAGDIDATISGGNAWTSTTLDFTQFGLTAGQWVKAGSAVAGSSFATTPACNGWYRIKTVAANRLDFDIVPTGFAASSETTSKIRVFIGDYMVNGVTEHSYTIEREFGDHSPVTYEYFRGMEVGNVTFQFDAQAIMTAAFTFMGKDATMQDSGRLSGSTTVAAPTADVLNTSSNVGRIGVGGSVVTGPNYVMSASIQINNNLRRRNAVGVLGSTGLGNGEFGVTGTLNTYFGNKTIAQQVLANTASSYDIRVGRADGDQQTILFDLPRLKFSAGSPSVSGKNADVMVDVQFTAFRHETLLYSLLAQRFWYIA